MSRVPVSLTLIVIEEILFFGGANVQDVVNTGVSRVRHKWIPPATSRTRARTSTLCSVRMRLQQFTDSEGRL